jgi:hypothetical protein
MNWKERSINIKISAKKMGVCQKDAGVNRKSSQWPNPKEFEQENKNLVLDYNPKYKIIPMSPC